MPEYSLDTVKGKILKISKWLGLIVGIIVSIVIVIRIASFAKNLFFPPPEPAPQVSFGRLPKMFMPQGIKKDFKYSVDTLTGDLPQFPSQVKVFKTVFNEPDILAVQRADERIKNLGFNIGPEQLSDTVYRWRSDEALNKNLIVSLKLPEFVLSSTFISDQSVLAGELPTEAGAVEIAKGFAQALSFYPEDIDEGKTKTQLLTIDGSGVIIPATSFSRAKLISVYFFQKDIEDIPVVYPQGGLSTMNFTVASGVRGAEVIDSRFFYQKISDEGATYPIKTAANAFDELKTNKAFIVSHSGNDLGVLIKKVYLGYYIEGRAQDFLVPVIVFEGNNNFFAYVPAVTDEWIDR